MTNMKQECQTCHRIISTYPDGRLYRHSSKDARTCPGSMMMFWKSK